MILWLVPTALAAEPSLASAVAEATVTSATRLVDAGRGPREVLRYAPKEGAEARCAVEVSMDMAMDLALPDGQKMAMPGLGKLPTVTSTLTHSVSSPEPGLWVVRLEQGAPTVASSVNPEFADAMEATPPAALDLRVQDGRVVAMDVVSAPSEVTEILKSLADRVTPFPEEPVGEGAKWTVDTTMDLMGMHLLTTQSYTLLRRTPGSADLGISFTMNAPASELTAPGIPPGAAKLVKFAGQGGGSQTVDLTTLATTGAWAVDLELALEMTIPGTPATPMNMKMSQQTRSTREP